MTSMCPRRASTLQLGPASSGWARDLARFVIERGSSERATACSPHPGWTRRSARTGSRCRSSTVPLRNGEPGFPRLGYGSWVVAVYDYPADGEFADARMTEEERALWGEALPPGHETGDGWLVLEASPAAPARARPTGGGPPVSITLEGETPPSKLGLGWCPPPGGDNVDPADGYVFWCPAGQWAPIRRPRPRGASATVLERLTAGLDVQTCLARCNIRHASGTGPDSGRSDRAISVGRRSTSGPVGAGGPG